MPLYRCSSPASALDDDKRLKVVESITEIHCTITGAPRSFVHVFFFDEEEGSSHKISGSIRSGRDEEKRELLHSQMTEAYSEIAGVSSDQVSVMTTNFPAKWTMEHGAVLPEPGEEAEWVAAHSNH